MSSIAIFLTSRGYHPKKESADLVQLPPNRSLTQCSRSVKGKIHLETRLVCRLKVDEQSRLSELSSDFPRVILQLYGLEWIPFEMKPLHFHLRISTWFHSIFLEWIPIQDDHDHQTGIPKKLDPATWQEDVLHAQSLPTFEDSDFGMFLLGRCRMMSLWVEE